MDDDDDENYNNTNLENEDNSDLDITNAEDYEILYQELMDHNNYHIRPWL